MGASSEAMKQEKWRFHLDEKDGYFADDELYLAFDGFPKLPTQNI